MIETSGIFYEAAPREIQVSAGTVFVHVSGEMTHVVLDPAVDSK